MQSLFQASVLRTSGASWLGLFAAGAIGTFSCNNQGVVIELAEATPSTEARAHVQSASEEDLNPRLLRRFAAIQPAAEQQPPDRVDLGRILYFEPLLSRTGRVSCNSCHPLSLYGTTNTRVAVGVDGLQGTRNAPSTYNATGHFRQFWDGRTGSMEEQARGPLNNPREMDMSADGLVRTLDDVAGYRPLFERAFPDDPRPISVDNLTKAVAAFEQGLVTPAPWDHYLAGDRGALSSQAKAGAKLFANMGCMVCHSGPYLGAATFERIGVRVPWPDRKDRGRRELTNNEADDMVFKVPSLRNVAHTAPYFHDGSVSELAEAVRLMAHHQLGLELIADEVSAIVTWLDALTGDLPVDYIATPVLPTARRP